MILKKFKTILICLLALSVCALGASIEPAMAAAGCPLDWQTAAAAAPVCLAMAATAIPAMEVENVRCVTAGVFRDLQQKYSRLYVIDVKIDETECYQFVVRRPTRQHLEVIASYGLDNTKINDFTIKNLVVAGNEDKALDDGIVFSAFNTEVGKIIGEAQSFLYKT